jgi:hypothetical protein
MSALLRLMKQLGADAALEAEYKKDPASVMDRFGLNEEERKALSNKDYATIRRLTGLKEGQYSTNTTIRAYDG